MAEVINLLALTPTMEEGTLAEWLVSEGDEVEEGQIIAEVETDKATMEMESFYDGTILEIFAGPGDTVSVGDPLAVIGEAGEDISDLLAELEGGGGGGAEEPADTEPPTEGEASAEESPAEAPEEEVEEGDEEGDERLKASPLARRIAGDEGLELREIEGSGPGGRIIKRDVEAALERRAQGAEAAETEAPARRVATAEPAEVPSRTEPLSQMRKTIARRLVEVWETTPHFYLTMEIDMARAMERRAELNEELAAADFGVKLSVNDLIVKACGVALARYPRMNVAFQGDHLVQYEEVHVGVAVAIEDGLITPRIKNTDQKGLAQIAREIRELAGRARDKKLTPDEYTGSTFSVSNLGMYGIHEFKAIINPPEAAILACGAVERVPVVDDDGELAVGTRMKVSLSCDHRAVDGAVGAEFLQEVRRLLERPALLLV